VIAIDTNVLVRLVTEDDEHQARRARALIDVQDRVLVPRTVLLELGWVLASTRYGFTRDRIAESLRTLLTIPNFELEDEAAVRRAVDWYSQGMDFADALHLASLGGEVQFATFDRSLVSTAERLGIGRVVAV
jgi:predicted nucleic-acid-binding protein